MSKLHRNSSSFLSSSIKQFEYYKSLGEKTFEQLEENQLFEKVNQASNSIAIIVNHLHGNMMSRWTDFLNSDGEKEFRKRDEEFEDLIKTKKQLLLKWNEGWSCLFSALNSVRDEDLERLIYIRKKGHSVTEAIHRQLAHYAYHIGQIVFLGTQLKGSNWESLSIPKGKSKEFNQASLAKGKRKEHFTDQFLK